MSHPFKILELLSAEDREALEAFAREKHRTVNALCDWVGAHGYKVSRGAVYAWREKFTAEDKFRASNEVARALADAAKNSGGVAIAEAATLQLQTMLFEAMLKMQMRGDMTPKELWAIAAAHKSAASTQSIVNDLRERFDQQMNSVAAKKPGGEISAEDIATARKAIFG